MSPFGGFFEIRKFQKQPMEKKTYIQRTQEIDSDLEFVEALGFNLGCVFRVKRNGIDYVLKAMNSRKDLEYHYAELSALKRAKNVKGITHLIEDYGKVGDWWAYLVEYAPGKDLRCVDIRNIKGKGLKKQLAKTIASLHLHGVAHRDLVKRNIIISPDYDKITLIDFNKAVLNKGYNLPFFMGWAAFDLACLGKLDL